MIDEKKLANATMSDEELDNVAGGTKEEWEDICKTIGKDPLFNSRSGVANILKNKYGIKVENWHANSNDSALAEFYINGTDKQLSFDQVKGIIRGNININEI